MKHEEQYPGSLEAEAQMPGAQSSAQEQPAYAGQEYEPAAAPQSTEVQALMAGVGPQSDEPEEPAQDTQFSVDAPYSVATAHDEKVQLNNGALVLNVVDFTLPGRDGFDLTIARRYDSSNASSWEVAGKPTAADPNKFYTKRRQRSHEVYTWRLGVGWSFALPSIEVTLPKDRDAGMLYFPALHLADGRSFQVRPEKGDMPKSEEEGYAEKMWALYNDPTFSNLYDHPQTDIKIRDLGKDENGALKQESIRHPYNSNSQYDAKYSIVVEYKDGSKDYFKKHMADKQEGTETKQVLDYASLTARGDRFGNYIFFNLPRLKPDTAPDRDAVDGECYIIDSWGRLITWTRENSTYNNETWRDIIWTLPDGSTVRYRSAVRGGAVTRRRLRQVVDQAGRETDYIYKQRTGSFAYAADDYDAGLEDGSEATPEEDRTNKDTTPFMLLTAVKHPSGAETRYRYGKVKGSKWKPMRLKLGQYGGFWETYPVTARADFNSSEAVWDDDGFETGDDPLAGGKNQVGYSYELSENGKYIEYGISQNYLGVTERCRFSNSNRMANKWVYHNGKQVLYTHFRYGDTKTENSYKLPTMEETKTYDPYNGQHNQKDTRWGYDGNANVTKITETYHHDNALSRETEMKYNATYSLMTEKKYKKDADTYIIEKYTLAKANRVIGRAETYEQPVGGAQTKQAATLYEYSDSANKYRPTAEKRVVAENAAGLEAAEAQGSFETTLYEYRGGNHAEYFTHEPVLRRVLGAPGPDMITTTAYDAMGRVQSVMDGLGNTTMYEYDALGRVTKTAFMPAPGNGLYTEQSAAYYDADNYVVTTDAANYRTRHNYTPLGLADSVWLLDVPQLAAGELCTGRNHYDSYGRLLREEAFDENCQGEGALPKRESLYSYDLYGRVMEKSIPQSGYSEKHRYEDVVDARPLLGKPNTAPAENWARHTVTVYGDVCAPTTTQTTYTDQAGLVRREEAGGEWLATHSYDLAGNRLYTTAPLGHCTEWTYDHAGRVLRTQRHGGGGVTNRVTSLNAWDTAGHKRSSTGWRCFVTTYSYDAAGRLTETVAPVAGQMKAVTRCEYDAVGNLVRQRTLKSGTPESGEWRDTEFKTDAYGRQTDVWRQTEGARLHTHTEYDEAGNKIFVANGPEDGDYHTKSWGNYDRFGNAWQMTDSLGAVETAVYSATGQLKQRCDRRGTITGYSYDAMDRLVCEVATPPHDEDIPVIVRSSRYARAGQTMYKAVSEYAKPYVPYNPALGEEANAGASVALNTLATQYRYDARGRLAKQIDGGIAYKAFAYDVLGNRTGFALHQSDITIPDIKLRYEYDTLDRLVLVWNEEADRLLAQYTYDEAGNRKEMFYPNSVRLSYAYNEADRVTDITVMKSSDVTHKFTYSYGPDGSQTAKTEQTGAAAGNLAHNAESTTTGTSYTYDLAGRLVREDITETVAHPGYTPLNHRAVCVKDTYIDTAAPEADNALDTAGVLIAKSDGGERMGVFGFELPDDTAQIGRVTRARLAFTVNALSGTGHVLRAYALADHTFFEDKAEGEALGVTAQNTPLEGAVPGAAVMLDGPGSYAVDVTDYLRAKCAKSGMREVCLALRLEHADGNASASLAALPDAGAAALEIDSAPVLRLVRGCAKDTFIDTVDAGTDHSTGANAGGIELLRHKNEARERKGLFEFDLSNVSDGMLGEVQRAMLRLRVAAAPEVRPDRVLYACALPGDVWPAGADDTTGLGATAANTRVGKALANGRRPARVRVPTTGEYLLEVTDYVREALAAGQRKINLAVRMQALRPMNAGSSAGVTLESANAGVGCTLEVESLPHETRPVHSTGLALAYQYDGHGNRTRLVASGLENYNVEYSYDANERLLQMVKTGADFIEHTEYEYDAAGNQLRSQWRAEGPRALARPGWVGIDGTACKSSTKALDVRRYNALNQLVRLRRGGLDVQYRYGPGGLRHSKTVRRPFAGGQSTTTVCHWDGQHLVMETSPEGDIKRRYLRGSSLVAQQIAGSLQYYLHNAHGDVVQRMGENGNNAPRYRYDAFGNEPDACRTDPNPWRYCGEYRDAESGEYYLRTRSYNPETGRFTSEDIAKSGTNWYAYCDGDPVQFTDPSGMFGTLGGGYALGGLRPDNPVFDPNDGGSFGAGRGVNANNANTYAGNTPAPTSTVANQPTTPQDAPTPTSPSEADSSTTPQITYSYRAYEPEKWNNFPKDFEKPSGYGDNDFGVYFNCLMYALNIYVPGEFPGDWVDLDSSFDLSTLAGTAAAVKALGTQYGLTFSETPMPDSYRVLLAIRPATNSEKSDYHFYVEHIEEDGKLYWSHTRGGSAISNTQIKIDSIFGTVSYGDIIRDAVASAEEIKYTETMMLYYVMS